MCSFSTAEGSSYMNIHVSPHPGQAGSHCTPGWVTLQSQGLMSSRRLVWRRSRAKFSLEANCRRSRSLICFKITSHRSSTKCISEPLYPNFLIPFFQVLFCILELFSFVLQSFCDISSSWARLLLLSSLSPQSKRVRRSALTGSLQVTQSIHFKI